MTQFRLHIDGDYDSGWLGGGQGAQTLASTLDFGVGASDMLILSIRTELTEDQLQNFVALLAKTWHHVSFMAGTELTPPVNPWAVSRDGGLDWSRILPATIRYVRDESYHVFEFRLRAGLSPKAAGCIVLRLAGLADWSILYSDRVRLTTGTRFKWATFNTIAVDLQPGMEFPVHREAAEAASEADTEEGDEPFREVTVDPANLSSESRAMLTSIGQNLGDQVNSISFVDERRRVQTTVPLPNQSSGESVGPGEEE